MSYYDKKYIKGEHKKHECKDDCKKEYHKYEEKEYHKYEEKEENGLLTEFQVDQVPSVPVSSTGLPNLANQFAEVEVCVDDSCDRVALDLTVEWQPDSLDIVGTIALLLAFIAALVTGATLPLALPATFRIWRKSSSGTTLISEKTDTSPIFGLSVLTDTLISIPFSRITTSIHAVDTDPDLGENEYFATIGLGPIPPGTVVPGPSDGIALPAIPFAQSGITIDATNVISYTFTASEIEGNE
ncbi:hypothetical protein BGM24_13425 [Bacillus sp. FJAT-26377]|nr:hypothetical protein [Bacillus sp. FJAT-26377]